MNNTEKHQAQEYLEWCVSFKRMHGSQTEAEFVATLAHTLIEHPNTDTTFIDCVGNLHALVGKSRTMFTAHTDTVHYSGGENHWEIVNGQMVTDGKHALGADDGCGIAIMLHMIDNGVPGRYVFFRGEECGGIGSKGIVRGAPEMFTGITRAIAFDRAGTGDVITHQAGSRCCSDEFAQALADELNMGGMMYLADSTGVYTDTKEFTGIVPECTNLSVGYNHQHGPNETVNMAHFLEFADRCLIVKWDDLPVKRDPRVKETWAKYEYGGYTKSANMSRLATHSVWADDFVGEPDDTEETEKYETLVYALEKAMDGHYTLLAELLTFHMFPDEPEQHDTADAYYAQQLPRIGYDDFEEYIDALENFQLPEDILDSINNTIIRTQP